MSTKRMMRREKRREYLIDLKSEERSKLIAQIKDPSVDIETKQVLYAKLESMPRDSSPVRHTRRCQRTGKARGVYRRFGWCRNVIRRHAMLGDIPGLVKASW